MAEASADVGMRSGDKKTRAASPLTSTSDDASLLTSSNDLRNTTTKTQRYTLTSQCPDTTHSRTSLAICAGIWRMHAAIPAPRPIHNAGTESCLRGFR